MPDWLARKWTTQWLSTAALCLYATGTLAAADFDLDNVAVGWKDLWFDESIKSASRKCETFSPRRTGGWHCTIGDQAANVIFDGGKIIGFSFPITQQRYSEVTVEIARRTGVQNRHETDDGFEFWGFNQLDENGKLRGIVIVFAARGDSPAELSHFAKLPKWAYAATPKAKPKAKK